MTPEWHRIGSAGPRGSQNASEIMQKWCQSGSKGRSRVDPGAGPETFQNDTKRYQNGAKMVSKWSRNGTQMLETWVVAVGFQGRCGGSEVGPGVGPRGGGARLNRTDRALP